MHSAPPPVLRPLRSTLGGALRGVITVLAAVLLVAVTALPAFAQDPVMEMVSTGTGDKVQLRFKPQVGSTQTVDFLMKMSMKMDGPMPMDMDMPGMKLGMRTTVTNVAANGDITYDLEVIDASVEGEGSDPMMKGMMEKQVQGMVGTKATIVSDAMGNTKESDFTPPPGAPPELVQNLRKSMKGSNANLPEQAVGVGAKWTLSQKLEENGVSVDQVTTYEVTELDDKGVKLKVDIKQQGKTGPMEDPNLPPGATATIDKFEGGGQGSTRFEFAHPMVVQADLEVNISTSMTMSMQGQTQQMNMDMGMSTSISKR